MSTPDPLDAEVAAFEATAQRLLETIHRLNEENRGLRRSQEQLNTDRANLMARNEQARNRVEAMIRRLKALEDNA